MPWAVAAAGVTAAAGLGGAAMQSGASSKAANASRQDARIAYLMEDANLKPYRDAGASAISQIQGVAGDGWGGYQNALRQGFQADPGYQFQLEEGQKALAGKYSADHLSGSGAMDKALLRYSQGLADQSYGAYADRFNNYVNKLFTLASLGQSSAVHEGNAGVQLAGQSGQAAMANGAAQNSIIGNTAQGIGNTVNSLFNNKDFQGLFRGGGDSVYSSTPNLIWNPNNPVGTETLGGATANNGWFANNFGFGG